MFGRPRSPSHFGISYSRMRWSRNVFHVSSQTSRWSWWRSSRVCVRTSSRVDPSLQRLERVLDLGADDTGRYPSRKSWTSTSAEPRRARNASALARASAARSPCAREDDPVTTSSGSRASSVRIVPPHPISMSSAWQPIASTRRSGVAPREGQQRRASGRGLRRRAASSRRAATAPGRTRACPSSRCRSLIVSIGPKNPRTGTRRPLLAGSGLRERLLDELVARLDPVEDLAAETKKPPLIRTPDGSCPRRATPSPSSVDRRCAR